MPAVKDVRERQLNSWVHEAIGLRGTISITKIDPVLVKCYNLQVHDITPWTRLRITE